MAFKKTLSKKTCKVYIAKKLNTKSHIWENRLSIIENVNGKNQEVFFIKNSSDNEFLKNLENKLKEHHMKHFSIIRRNHRYSKTFHDFFKKSEDMKQISHIVYEKVEKLLIEAKTRSIVQKNNQDVTRVKNKVLLDY